MVVALESAEEVAARSFALRWALHAQVYRCQIAAHAFDSATHEQPRARTRTISHLPTVEKAKSHSPYLLARGSPKPTAHRRWILRRIGPSLPRNTSLVGFNLVAPPNFRAQCDLSEEGEHESYETRQ